MTAPRKPVACERLVDGQWIEAEGIKPTRFDRLIFWLWSVRCRIRRFLEAMQ